MHLSKEEVTKLVGQKIREIRLKKRLTIERAAHNAGLEYTQLSRIELGKINTSIYHVFMITESLDVKMQEIFKDIHNHKYHHNGQANGDGLTSLKLVKRSKKSK
jgi:transcriptional regulator with XRE-family HTH domain